MGGGLTPLQRYSWYILQPQPTGQSFMKEVVDYDDLWSGVSFSYNGLFQNDLSPSDSFAYSPKRSSEKLHL